MVIKTLGTVVVLLFFYVGIFGVHINASNFKMNINPFLTDWIEAVQDWKKDADKKVDDMKEDAKEFGENVKDKVTGKD